MERARLAALALLLLAVLGGIAGLLWRSETPLDPTLPTAASGDPAAPTATEAALARTEGAPSAGEAAGRHAAETARDPVAATERAPRLVRVRVIVKATGAPAPGAEVLFAKDVPRLEGLGPAEQDDVNLLRADREQWLRRLGQSVRADGDGIALVPLRNDRLDLVARHGELYGELVRPWYEDPSRREDCIELEPDRVLRVQVQDATRRPVAGVLVALRGARAQREDGGRDDHFQVHGRSQADGMLEIRHLQRLVKTVHEARVVAAEPGLDGDGPAVDLAKPPAEPVVLQLAPFGQLVVKVQDEQGQPIVRPLRVQVQVQQGTRRTGTPHSRGTNTGTVTFPFVGLGTSLQVSAGSGDDRNNQRLAGPATAGQVVTATIVLGAGRATWRGRAVDEQGQPIASRRLAWRFAGSRFQTSGDVVTDAEGLFVIGLGKNTIGQVPDAMVLRLQPGAPDEQPQGLAAKLVPGQIQAGDRDFGDVRFALGPLLISGRLTGDDPEALARVTLSVQQPSRRTGTRESWTAARDVSVLRLPDSRFEVRGESESPRLSLTTYSDVHLPVPRLELQAPAHDVVLRLERGAELLALVLCDLARASGRLTLQLTRTDQTGPRPYQAQLLEQDGERWIHRWLALPAGRYRFELRLDSATRPVVAFDDVVIAASGRSEDPRLAQLDLRGKLRTIQLTFVESGGKPARVDWGAAVVRDLDPQVDGAGVQLNGARATIVTAAPYVDLLIAAAGYRLRTVEGIANDQEVVLERPTEVTVRLGADSQPPAGGTIAVRLEAVTDQGRFVRMWGDRMTLQQILGNGGETTVAGDRGSPLSISLPGRYRVVAMAAKGEQRGPPIASLEPKEVVIGDGPTATIELQLPREAMLEAFRPLGLGVQK